MNYPINNENDEYNLNNDEANYSFSEILVLTDDHNL